MNQVLEVVRLPLDAIEVDQGQDRQYWDQKELADLADSIAREGQVSPGVVIPIGQGKYRIVAGERRFRACCLLEAQGRGKGYYLATVGELSDQQALNVQLLENVARANLRPTEEARAFARRVEAGQSVQEVAEVAGKPLEYIRRRIALLNLVPEVALLIDTGQLATGYGEVIADLPQDVQGIAARESGSCRDLVAFRAMVAERWQGQKAAGLFDGEDYQIQADRVKAIRDGAEGKRIKRTLDTALEDLGRVLMKAQDPLLPIMVAERRQAVKQHLELARDIVSTLIGLIEDTEELEAQFGDKWPGEYLDRIENRLRELA